MRILVFFLGTLSVILLQSLMASSQEKDEATPCSASAGPGHDTASNAPAHAPPLPDSCAPALAPRAAPVASAETAGSAHRLLLPRE